MKLRPLPPWHCAVLLLVPQVADGFIYVPSLLPVKQLELLSENSHRGKHWSQLRFDNQLLWQIPFLVLCWGPSFVTSNLTAPVCWGKELDGTVVILFCCSLHPWKANCFIGLFFFPLCWGCVFLFLLLMCHFTGVVFKISTSQSCCFISSSCMKFCFEANSLAPSFGWQLQGFVDAEGSFYE